MIIPRAARTNGTDYTDITMHHLENFAKEGLRTLVLAYRKISEEEYSVRKKDLIIFYQKLNFLTCQELV